MRQKCYDTAADKQAAYRKRKREESIDAVPVLAEPSCAPESCEGGEARESNKSVQGADRPYSRGGILHHKADKVIMAEARKRAERAKRYALKFPHFCGKSDEVFQTVEWQYARELRYQRKEQIK